VKRLSGWQAAEVSTDCRTCNRRRIRCDRSLPTCKKCALKELTCPGYGLRIQFGQGVASRGKLMGKELPVIEPAPAPLLAVHESSISPQSTSTEGRIGSGEEAAVLAPHHLRTAFGPTTLYDAGAAQNAFALNLDIPSHAIPQYLQHQPVRELIHYYDNHLAGLMPWVDSPDNAWRTLLLPLALKSRSLLLAILALSIEHSVSKAAATWPVDAAFFRDKSLQLLARDLKTELNEEASPARQTQASGILATILILCNVEMIRCETGIWHVHWKAARTIARRWTAPHLPATDLDATCRFLLREAFVYDVFGSSTTFGDIDQIPGSFLANDEAGLFTGWLQLVQEVTCTERRRSDLGLPDGLPPELSNMSNVQRRFQNARDHCHELAQSYDFGSPSPDHNFLVLIDIFHHAGLVYTFSTLFDGGDPAVQVEVASNVRAVIELVSQILHHSATQHDLVWPIFVVGIQGRHDLATQEFARAKLTEVMDSTGFSNCRPALEFLHRFWSSDPSIVPDWMHFAREEAKRGQYFLVI
jgi:hypothetical protein